MMGGAAMLIFDFEAFTHVICQYSVSNDTFVNHNVAF